MYLQKREKHIFTIFWTRFVWRILKHVVRNEHEDALFYIEVFKAEVFIPDEYIVIRCHNVRMQKPFSIPPCDENHNQRDSMVK